MTKILAFLLLAAACLLSHAAELAYVGADGGDWDTAANWSPSQVPTASDDVVVGRWVKSSGSVSAKSITLRGSSAYLTVGGTLKTVDGQIGANPSSSDIVRMGVVGDLILDGGRLTVGGRRQNRNMAVSVGGNLVVSNAAQACFYAGATEGVCATNWVGSAKLLYANANVVSVGGQFSVCAGSTVFAENDRLTGTPVFFKVSEFLEEAGAALDATARGWARFIKSDWSVGGAPVGAAYDYDYYTPASVDNFSYAFGPGYFFMTGGGNGGIGCSAGNLPVPMIVDEFGGTEMVTMPMGGSYGYERAPFLPGSPSGVYNGNRRTGGGSVCVFVSGSATVNGRISADAEALSQSGGYGGAAGGSIWIAAQTMSIGRSARLSACGGNSNYSSTGGGGRISLMVGATEEEVDLMAGGDTPGNMCMLDLLDVAADRIGGTQQYYNPGCNQKGLDNSGTARLVYNEWTRVPVVVTAVGEEFVEVVPQYGMNVLDRSNLPAFAVKGGGALSLDPYFRNLKGSTFSKVVLSDETGEIESLENAVGVGRAVWSGKSMTALRLKVVGGGSVAVNGETYEKDATVWIDNEGPAELSAIAGAGSFLRFVGDIPGGMSTASSISVPLRPCLIVQAVFSDAAGVEKTFSGEAGGMWDEVANWSPEGIPSAVDMVKVTRAVRCYNVAAAGAIAVEDGGQLLVGGLPDTLETDPLRSNPTVPAEYVCAAGLCVSGDMTATGSGEIVLGARGQTATLECASVCGNLSLGGSARLTVHAAPYPADGAVDEKGCPLVTNFYYTAFAVKIGGRMSLDGNSVVIPDCDIESGNPIRFEVGGGVAVGESALFDSRLCGFGWVMDGISFHTRSTTAGGSWDVGGVYAGNVCAPYVPGAPSGITVEPTRGGGVVWIKTPGVISLKGRIDASGGNRYDYGVYGGSEGGSSGGGVWLVCSRLIGGKDAAILARGGYCGHISNSGIGGSGGDVSVARKLTDDQLERLAMGEDIPRVIRQDEIAAVATDVKCQVNKIGPNPNLGPEGMTTSLCYPQGLMIRLQ